MAEIHERGSGSDGESPWLRRLRSAIGDMDLIVGVLLGAMLLPLIIGPLVLLYMLVTDGAYTEAVLIGSLFAGCVTLAIRAVRRGEWGPSILAAVLALLAILVFMAMQLKR